MRLPGPATVARARWELRVRAGAPAIWLARAVRTAGREREALLQACKMAIATVVAWLVARHLLPQESFLAPYSAVFVMSTTVYRSLTNAVRQLLALGLGVLLAFGAGQFVPHPVAALGVAVLVGMLVGQWQRLGASGMWVGVTALLVITIGNAEHGSYLAYRLAASALGAGIGVAVNLLVLPPVHLRLPEQAVATLGVELRDLLRDICRGLHEGLRRDSAIRYLQRARALDTAVRRANDAVGWGRESTRLNPRWFALPHHRYSAPADFEPPIRTLQEVSRSVQQITEVLVGGGEPHGDRPEFDRALGILLSDLAEAVAYYRDPIGSLGDERFTECVRRAREQYGEMEGKVGTGGIGPVETERRQGALLLAVDRALRALPRHSG